MSDHSERKDLLSQLFVVLLIGLAYQEMIQPVRDTVRAEGITLSVFALSVTFFLTSLRFFIGAQLHLVDESITKSRTPVWIIDFMVIVFEMVLFIFLAGLTSVDANESARYDFLQVLLLIYLVDIFWVFLQYVLGWVKPNWSRSSIPWKWAAINFVASLLLLLIYFLRIDPYSNLGLWILLVVNFVAYIFDVFIVDYFYVVKEPETPVVIS